MIVEDQIEFISHELLKGAYVKLAVVGVMCRLELRGICGGGRLVKGKGMGGWEVRCDMSDKRRSGKR